MVIDVKVMMDTDKIKVLNSIIDELSLQTRKIEYSSALERLTRRVTKLEEQIELIKVILSEKK